MTFKIIALLSFFSVTLYAERSIVLVDDPGDYRAIFPVVEMIGDKSIILADQTHLSMLKQQNISHQIIDASIEGKHYFLVFPFVGTPDQSASYSLDILNKYGKVLTTFDKWLLMESTEQQLHAITEYQIKLDYLELEPLHINHSDAKSSMCTAAPNTRNPVIERMMQMVNPDSVASLQRKLCSFKTRHAKSTVSKNEVTPWLKQMFKNYKCDTVMEFPISGCSPAVVGVRFGTKERSLNKFTLLGGHNDNIIGGAPVETKHQGANDNATGTVAVLEAARVHQHFSFDYTILYCAFNGEELGLYGSNAIMSYLNKNKFVALGGLFTYDMFGMSKNDITFRVYTGISGADEFVNQMTQIKKLYGFTQPAGILTTSDGNPPTDSKNIWKNGYLGIVHNFATAGGGAIHTSADTMTSRYDKTFQAECAKLGIATTAIQAGVQGVSHISSTSYASRLNNANVQCITTTNGLTFILNQYNIHQPQTFTIFDFTGRQIKKISSGDAITKVEWNLQNTKTPLAGNQSLIVRYTDGINKSTVNKVKIE